MESLPAEAEASLLDESIDLFPPAPSPVTELSAGITEDRLDLSNYRHQQPKGEQSHIAV